MTDGTVLTRAQLTATLMARQLLAERAQLPVDEAVSALAALQAQWPPAPHVALWSRLRGFERGTLDAALEAGSVVKTTAMRGTLHIVAAADYPAYAATWQPRVLGMWVGKHPALGDVAGGLRERVAAYAAEPRLTTELRAFTAEAARGALGEEARWDGLQTAKALVPLVHLPPSGRWKPPRSAHLVRWGADLPSEQEGAALLARRYLAAFGPASRQDLASFSGLTQRVLVPALETLELRRYRDEDGRELLDLAEAPIAPADLPLPVRLVGRWDQPLMAYRERERLLPPGEARRIPLSGEQGVLVDGRVAGVWQLRRRGEAAELAVEPFQRLTRAQREVIEAEALALLVFAEPDAGRRSVAFL